MTKSCDSRTGCLHSLHEADSAQSVMLGACLPAAAQPQPADQCCQQWILHSNYV